MKSLPSGITAAAAVASVLVGVPASAAQAPATAGDAAEAVDMEAVLLAAQIDPQRPDQSPTPGSSADVQVVERALEAEGLLEQGLVDGHYGTATVSAYTAYQRSLGYEGVAANGLPGRQSLGRLSEGRFHLTHVVLPGEHTRHSGKEVNARTEAMLAEAQRRLGHELVLTQGSYNPGGDPTSAGTHDGGGVVDISVSGMDAATRSEVVRVLRTVGFAAWHRTPSQGNWPHHIHAAAISDPDLSTPAQHQTGDYHLGKNGLANEAPDDGPEVKPIRTWEEYRRTN
jgi:peptidoglycan hydrolase-like protein with peptidoglycan-binding domain